MRKWIVAAALLGVVLVAFILSRPKPPPPTPELPRQNSGNGTIPPLPLAIPKTSSVPLTTNGIVSSNPPAAPEPASFAAPAPAMGASAAPPAEPPPNVPPDVVLDNMRITIRSFASAFGSNPVGTNPEITRALDGGNPQQIHFIHPDSGLRINSQGELVDWWGTPFFFHQLSGKEMEIHSAGPDRIMWTRDDLVTK